MKKNALLRPLPWLTLLGYILMVAVNALANALPINGRTTGAVSNAYENLFAPAGITFSIWGLIYLLLLIYTLYQFKYYKEKTPSKIAFIDKVNRVYLGTCLINSLWIVAWHYDYILVSLLLMIGLLVCLIQINSWQKPRNFKGLERWTLKFPFAVYFGWITVATIANVTVWLVSIGWDGFGIEDYIWTCLVIVIGAAIGGSVMRKLKSLSYGMVLIWAYGGILLKHISPSGFNGQYTSVILLVSACIVFFLSQGFIILKKRQ